VHCGCVASSFCVLSNSSVELGVLGGVYRACEVSETQEKVLNYPLSCCSVGDNDITALCFFGEYRRLPNDLIVSSTASAMLILVRFSAISYLMSPYRQNVHTEKIVTQIK